MKVGKRICFLGVIALVVGSCSWLVEPKEEPLRCSADAGILSLDSSANPCPEGFVCDRAMCRKCEPKEICGDEIDNDCNGLVDGEERDEVEQCDGLDNDCDGKPDDPWDLDLDNWISCARDESMRDCEDNRDDRFPGNPEICDGQDNDCNYIVDDAPAGRSLCNPDSRCEGGKCVKLTCANDPALRCIGGQTCVDGACTMLPAACMACTADQECVNERCQPRAKRENGARCSLHGDCASDLCIDAQALRLGEGKVCAQACCSDDSCPMGQHCFASGTGARSCLPNETFPVSSSSEQCTATSAQCAPRLECGLTSGQNLATPPFGPRVSNLTTTACRAPTRPARTGELCPNPTQCSTNICVSGIYAGQVCSIPCGRSSDCAALSASGFAFDRQAYCRYVRVESGGDAGLGDASQPAYASVCVLPRSYEVGDKLEGQTCVNSADCKERGCIGAENGREGHCLKACCSDAHCTPSARPGMCRPFKVGMGYEMRCDQLNPP